MKYISIILLLCFVAVLSGCTTTQKSACIGALGGATAGGAAGYFYDQDQSAKDKREDAWMGAGIGALSGAIIGGIIGYFTAE